MRRKAYRGFESRPLRTCSRIANLLHWSPLILKEIRGINTNTKILGGDSVRAGGPGIRIGSLFTNIALFVCLEAIRSGPEERGYESGGSVKTHEDALSPD